MQYYLHIPLPPALVRRIKAFRKTWQPETTSEPHITLIIPTSGLGEVDRIALVAQLREALADIQPFPVKLLDTPGHFDDKRTVYLEVERSAPLVRCQEAARRGIEGHLKQPSGPYATLSQPHATLATRLDSETSQKAWKAALAQDWGDEFLCQEVQVLGRSPHAQAWEVIGRIPLGHPEPSP